MKAVRKHFRLDGAGFDPGSNGIYAGRYWIHVRIAG